MEVRCKSSKRFLYKINIEEYYTAFKKSGLDIKIPIVIEVPCPKCKMIEVYEIYPETYKHVRSYKYDK